MKFGPASPAEAIGGVTVHTLRQGSLVLKKGTTIGDAEAESLERAGPVVHIEVVERLGDHHPRELLGSPISSSVMR